eukprot:7025469-Pyramimonas_sp.AAC.1
MLPRLRWEVVLEVVNWIPRRGRLACSSSLHGCGPPPAPPPDGTNRPVMPEFSGETLLARSPHRLRLAERSLSA